MNDEQYRQYCLDLLSRFAGLMEKEVEGASADDPLRELAEAFASLNQGGDHYEKGPALVARLFASCPHLAPAFPREALWFFGGDCLHYMPDEELQQFQKLDDMRLEALSQELEFDYQQARAKLLKLQ